LSAPGVTSWVASAALLAPLLQGFAAERSQLSR